MMEISPKTDFYISATVGMINAFHVADFHRSWIEQGLIKPQDFNFNLLQYPIWQRMDIFPKHIKEQVEKKYREHIEWLKGKDPLTRATKGFESAINWMWAKDNESKLSLFWENTLRYDAIRNERTLDIFPELQELYNYYEKNKTQ